MTELTKILLDETEMPNAVVQHCGRFTGTSSTTAPPGHARACNGCRFQRNFSGGADRPGNVAGAVQSTYPARFWMFIDFGDPAPCSALTGWKSSWIRQQRFTTSMKVFHLQAPTSPTPRFRRSGTTPRKVSPNSPQKPARVSGAAHWHLPVPSLALNPKSGR